MPIAAAVIGKSDKGLVVLAHNARFKDTVELSTFLNPRALQDAGLKTDGNGLQFSLRDQNAGQQAQRDSTPSQTSRILVSDAKDVTPEMPRYYGTRLGGVDIRI